MDTSYSKGDLNLDWSKLSLTVPSISIREADLNPKGNSHPKHQEHASSVERKVISKKSVELRPKPLSIPSLVTKPASKRSSNS